MSHPPQPTRESLRPLLAASEKRKAAELKRVNRQFSRLLIFGTPIVVLVLWVTVILRQNPSEDVNADAGSTTVETPTRTGSEKLRAQLDHFKSEDPTSGTQAKGGKLIETEDVRFAMELLNFMDPAGTPKSEQQ
jgi:hypothetical protein